MFKSSDKYKEMKERYFPSDSNEKKKKVDSNIIKFLDMLTKK